MKNIKVEQMTIPLGEEQSACGEESQQNSQTISTTKKQEKSTKTSSRYHVKVGNVVIKDVIDYVTPSNECPFWTFVTSDKRHIEATGNIIVEGL